MIGWQASLQLFLQTFNEILTAGVAITGFSLLLYAISFNLRDRVARSFALILIFTVVVYTAEAIGSIVNDIPSLNFWLRLQWVGIVFLPAAYLHFSDALMATTGRPSRGRRRWAVRLTYAGSVIFLSGLPFLQLLGPVVADNPPAPHLQTTWFTDLFVIFYLGVMLVSWINFLRALRRTTTSTSQRRMVYLMMGAVAPALGAFPFLPYSPNLAAQHQLTFWSVAVFANILVGILLIVMAYSVAFFGVSWPDRVVKTRLFKWIMRGPFTASITLAATTMTRRAGEAFGSTSYSALVPIVMVGTILLSEYLITLFSPLWERFFFFGNDKSELEVLHSLENQLVTRNDLRQFLEMVLAASSDRLQAAGAYVVALKQEGMELVVTSGETRFSDSKGPETANDALPQHIFSGHEGSDLFRWGEDVLFPLWNGTAENPELIGLLGVSSVAPETLDDEHLQAMEVLAGRAALALRNRRIQQQVFRSLETLSDEVGRLQRMRAASQYDQTRLLAEDGAQPRDSDLAEWVKDALSHYWGGPKLTQSPLMRLKIVEQAMQAHDGNSANAMRSILREAIDRVRPEGERRFTGEWILYNILEMKFVEGRKVREVAMRLAMSEADLYRKQRIAVEAVAKAIGDMEVEARKGVAS